MNNNVLLDENYDFIMCNFKNPSMNYHPMANIKVIHEGEQIIVESDMIDEKSIISILNQEVKES